MKYKWKLLGKFLKREAYAHLFYLFLLPFAWNMDMIAGASATILDPKNMWLHLKDGEPEN